MQGVQKILNDLDLNTESVVQLVQQVRTLIDSSADPLNKANQFIKTITDIDVAVSDIETAIPLAQYVAKTALEEVVCDFRDVINRGYTYVSELHKRHPWSAPKIASQMAGPVVAIVDGIDVKVEVKADGSLKKGAKRILADELYKKYMLVTTPLTNQQFIAILMKELKMTKAGSTTYAYDCKKKYQK